MNPQHYVEHRLGLIISDFHTDTKEKSNLCVSCEKERNVSHLKHSFLSFKKRKQRLLQPIPPYPHPGKKKKIPPIPFVSLKSQKDLKGFLLLYLHAKAKAHPIRFEGIIYSVQSQGLLWKKAQIQKEERAAITNQTGLGSRGRKKFRSNAV